jgi:hypothetical protein
MESGKGSGPRRLGIRLRQLMIVAASLAFLPVVLFSLAVFVTIFLVILVAALAYGWRLRSKLQRMESRQVVDADYDAVSDGDNQRKLPKRQETHRSKSEDAY